MPKKRHHTKYSKPQSTAPASLTSRSVSPRSSSHDDHPRRSVNELLSDLRRVSSRSQQPPGSTLISTQGAPTVPPTIRRILQLPETPTPPPRRPVRTGPNGARLPPGPAPPRSWLSTPDHTPIPSSRASVGESFRRNGLPGAYMPSRGSLMDMALRTLAIEWEFQKSFNHYYLYSLPTHLKVALIAYLGTWYAAGVGLSDLRAILLPCPEDELVRENPLLSPSTMNEDLFHLDVSGSLGRSLKLCELFDLLFPSAITGTISSPLQESWDVPTDASTIPRPLLPNITHLSLAVNPESASSVSWRQLLSFSSRLHTLTHLSLAYWPEPSLTPNAKLASFVSAQGRSVQYGGTGPYSHSLDDDWSEAVLVLRRLSKNLYGLEWLDLTGCTAWAPALMATAEHDTIDWLANWGKVSTVLLYLGYTLGSDIERLDKAQYRRELELASRVEKHIRTRRGGVGKRITVEIDQTGNTGFDSSR